MAYSKCQMNANNNGCGCFKTLILCGEDSKFLSIFAFICATLMQKQEYMCFVFAIVKSIW